MRQFVFINTRLICQLKNSRLCSDPNSASKRFNYIFLEPRNFLLKNFLFACAETQKDIDGRCKKYLTDHLTEIKNKNQLTKNPDSEFDVHAPDPEMLEKSIVRRRMQRNWAKIQKCPLKIAGEFRNHALLKCQRRRNLKFDIFTIAHNLGKRSTDRSKNVKRNLGKDF